MEVMLEACSERDQGTMGLRHGGEDVFVHSPGSLVPRPNCFVHVPLTNATNFVGTSG